jgi:ABC-2 type transport system ATP-binding protein
MEKIEYGDTTSLEIILKIERLQVSYGKKLAVDDLSFEIPAGIIFGLLGPNGAGKTTTMSAIEGLIKPQSGKISIAGTEMTKDPLKAKFLLGIQLQSTSFQSELTVFEIVRLYSGLYGANCSRKDIFDLLKTIHLKDEAHKKMKELSGGQQQRISLAIATIQNPRVVLLDEPTSGLDPQSRRQLWDRIREIKLAGRSVLLTTHSMEEAQAVCDFISIIDQGRIIANGTPSELIEMYRYHPGVMKASGGQVTLEDVFIGLTGKELRK